MDPDSENVLEHVVNYMEISDALDLLGFNVAWIQDEEGLTLSIRKKKPTGFFQGDDTTRRRKSWRSRLRDFF